MECLHVEGKKNHSSPIWPPQTKHIKPMNTLTYMLIPISWTTIQRIHHFQPNKRLTVGDSIDMDEPTVEEPLLAVRRGGDGEDGATAAAVEAKRLLRLAGPASSGGTRSSSAGASLANVTSFSLLVRRNTHRSKHTLLARNNCYNLCNFLVLHGCFKGAPPVRRARRAVRHDGGGCGCEWHGTIASFLLA